MWYIVHTPAACPSAIPVDGAWPTQGMRMSCPTPLSRMVGSFHFKVDLNPLSRTVEQVSIHSYEGVRVKLREMFLGFQNFCHHASVIPVFFIAAKNCDILIHEASYEDIYANRRSNNMHRYAILFMYCTGCYDVFT